VAKPPPHRAHLELAKEFYSRYQGRIVKGVATYGDFDAETDGRNMGTECSEEILDVGSYLDFGEQMRPDLVRFIQKMRAKTILLFGMAKQLEDMMRTPYERG
jgi:hypothetical protein